MPSAEAGSNCGHIYMYMPSAPRELMLRSLSNTSMELSMIQKQLTPVFL